MTHLLNKIYFYSKNDFPFKILMKIIKYCFNLPPNPNTMKKAILLCLLTCCSFLLMAQGSETDFFRNTGKIYVVVAIIAATFIGIILFLIYMERKVSKLERESEDKV